MPIHFQISLTFSQAMHQKAVAKTTDVETIIINFGIYKANPQCPEVHIKGTIYCA